MASTPHIVFHTGGPAFHPVADQADAFTRWLGGGYRCTRRDGLAAFDLLADADLLVVMGLHWTGMTADWAGSLAYEPMGGRQQAALEAFAAAGKPILAHHGGIASYDDWPRFRELVGFGWVWGTTNHSPKGDYRVEVHDTGHPVVAGVEPFGVYDELYYDVWTPDDADLTVHAHADWDGAARPMVMTSTGVGGGRRCYLANGHDMKAFEPDAMRKLWVNAVRWLLEEPNDE